MQSSDHLPLSICIDINIVPMLDMQGSDSQSTLKLLIVNVLPTRITAQNYSATFNSLERQYVARSPRAMMSVISIV